MNVDDLLPEVKEKVLDVLHQSPEWAVLTAKFQKAVQLRNYVKMQSIQQQMRDMEFGVVFEYLKALDNEKVMVADLIKDMEKEDADKLLTKLNGIGFLCDILYGYIIDSTDIINKYFPKSELIFYDKLLELSKEVKMHIKHVAETNDDLFCEQSDKAAEFIDKKVQQYMKRTKNESKRKVQQTR